MRRWIAAGAGSGKTESLVAQILDALSSGFAPGEILALTFTRAAAAELKQRVRVRLMAREAGGAAAIDIESLSVATFIPLPRGFCTKSSCAAATAWPSRCWMKSTGPMTPPRGCMIS